MFIKSMVLDGFKSYGERTYINDFDRQFNAITGLNGTGKSNILDAICFVLGITQLSSVRVNNLTDLVFRSGQTGITKASVSIIFDNTDKSRSPVGFHDYNEIIVTRQVAVGGKNKYLLNGCNATNKKVQDLFLSIQLNVNNPHFLIMQGRITKVLNMKPLEILSMIQEAAGTKMYETKKEAAYKSIQKKENKLKEINRLSQEEIIPKLNKLQEDRNIYKEYIKAEREVDNLNILFLGWQYYQSVISLDESKMLLEARKSDVDTAKEQIEKNMVRISELEKEMQDYLNKDSKCFEDVKVAENNVKEKDKEIVHIETKKKNFQIDLKNQKNLFNELSNNIKDDEATLLSKEEEMSKINDVFQQMKNEEETDKQKYLMAEKKFEALSAGLELGDDGTAVTLQDQLINLKKSASESASLIKEVSLRLNQEQQFLQKKQKAFLNVSVTESKKDLAELENLNKTIQNLNKQLESLNFNGEKLEEMKILRNEMLNERRALEDKLERFSASHPFAVFQYDNPEPNFNRKSVKGLVCDLIQVKDNIFCTALETAAGSRLFNVVTDTEATGKKLLKSGNLRGRVTIIPLNKIRGNPISLSTLKYAHSLTGENSVYLATDLINYNKDLKQAIDYIFGSVLICKDLKVAKIIAFNEKILRKCVTMDGDVVDPAGTVSGGSRAQNSSLLLKILANKENSLQFDVKTQEIEKLQSQIQNLEYKSDKYRQLKVSLDKAMTQQTFLKQKVEQSGSYQQQAEINDLKSSIKELTQLLKTHQENEKKTLVEIKKIEKNLDDSKNNRNTRIKEAEKEMKALKAQFQKSKELWKEKEQYFESLKMEISELQSLVIKNKDNFKTIENKINEIEAKIKEFDAVIENLKVELHELKAVYKAAKELVSVKNAEIAGKRKEKDKLAIKNNETNIEILKFQNDVKELEKKINNLETFINSVKDKQNDSVLQHVASLSAKDANDIKKKLTQTMELKNKLGRSVNIKAQILYEQEDKQYTELIKRKAILETERSKLFQFIETMDEKKSKFLIAAIQRISKEFGSIFSTLLPGANVKLVAVDENDLLAGVEIKVAFSGLWKNNLNELSGGQKSLVALSLILAMLLFKPAPLYILDEVDAALDLSHTQNIGRMLSKHFKQSQFIIVSLKDGMFNNANVLYKTQFINNVSSVTRVSNLK